MKDQSSRKCVRCVGRGSRRFGRMPATAANGVRGQRRSGGNGSASVVGQGRAYSPTTKRNGSGVLLTVRTCPQCDKQFEAKRAHAVYCSGKCKQKAYRVRKRKEGQHAG